MSYLPPTTPTFEKDRIRALKNERISSQKKTFTKWMNSFLNKTNLHINDLFEDLADGKLLISLLEIISGEKIGIAARGKFRIHNIHNINRALEFLQKSVKLESIGAEDIIDGNERLILGLVWMIILRFQIADISYEDEMSRERKSAKEALLLWCQRMTRGYPGVDIQNFTTSWRNGLAFNALLHKHRPDLIEYASLRPSQHEANLNNAFNVAEDRLGITRLLDAEDVDCPRPDDRSVMTYVSTYYQYFAKMKSEETGGRRVAKIISVLMEIEDMQNVYESMVSDLLSWINTKIMDLSKPFHKSLSAVQKEMMTFKHFRTIEKPPKYAERVNIEAHLYNLQTKRTANHQKPYAPPEGTYVKDVNRAWQVMENAEHQRALALRNELIRQEMLEKMADKFERKATLRESWLDDMMHVLEEEQLSQDAATVEAALKRHEAISTDVKAREERFQMVFNLAQELIDEDYHKSDAIRAREEVIMTKWDKLIGKLEGRRAMLMGFRNLVGVFRDMESAHSDLADIETGLRSEDYGRYLLAVENLLQKHSLVESQIAAQGERIQRINTQASTFIQAKHPESKVIVDRQKHLTRAYQALVELANERKARLEDSLKVYQFFGDLEEEEIFIKETEQLASSKEVGKDLTSLTRLRKRHEALEAEVIGRYAHCEVVFVKGQSLVDRDHFGSKDIKAKIKQVQANWIRVKELAQNRKERLNDAAQSLQYYSDANDAESWMTEKMNVVRSDDYGRDEQSATSLLQRHQQIQEEISSFVDDINKLKEQSKLMGESKKAKPVENQLTYETYTEEMEVETDEEVDEVVEKEVVKEVIKEVKVPQVIVLYPYTGQGLTVQKGETLFLISKANNDWWSVRRIKSREAGYVPAKYVKDMEPSVLKKSTKQKVMVPQTVKVKKKVKKIVSVERQRPLLTSPRPSPMIGKRGKGVRRHFTAHFDRDNVAVRQITLTNTYNRLVELSKLRRKNLENAIKFYHFCHECDDMEMWMTNKENQLNSRDDIHDSDIIQVTRKKLERFETELSTKNSSMAEINQMADELINDEDSNTAAVKKRRKELNERWGALQQLKQIKEEELEEKHGVELFYNSCQEMQSWLQEKEGLLYDEDVGRDIETVRALQRRHQGFERDLAAVEDKVTKLKDQARSLVSQHPRQARQIKTNEAEILGTWNGLKGKAGDRKTLLDDAYGQQGFLADARDLLSWANDAKQALKTAEHPQDISSANEMIQKHNEMLEDIETHYDRFDQLHDYAQKLLTANPRAAKVKQNVALLTEAKDDLSECWAERNDRLQQALDLQVFIRDAEQLDAVTASHEASLSNEDLGTSVDDVERLLKKHEDTDKTLVAQEEKVRGLIDMANSLIRADHYEKTWIAKRRDEVIKRRQSVKQRAKQRREALAQSQVLQNFLRDADEFDAWILEKLQIATDESYQDPKNLQGKLQRHTAFEAEIAANKDGIDRINTASQKLTKKKHFGSPKIQKRVAELNKNWHQLLTNSANKNRKLQQAHQQQQFNRGLEDFRGWMHDVETVLASEDLGRDLSEVKFLLKKHQLVEADIEVHVAEAEMAASHAQELINDEHFNAQSIQGSTRNVLKRFKDLKHLSTNRRSHLEDSFGLNQLVYDIELEMTWVREHERLASSEDLGSSLLAVQRLQKRHQVFQNELTNHQPKIQSVVSCGQDLIDSGHPASERVEGRVDELDLAWESLAEASAKRKAKLDESYESQKFFAEANEADSWMNDKAGSAASQDYGKEERATEKLLTRHRALETDVESFSDVVKGLDKDAKRLVRNKHFDSKKITITQRDLEEQLSGLKTLVSTRRTRLEESKKLHQYMREVDEAAEWINEQIHTSGSEDYGNDFEHLETIQAKFEDFQRSVAANTDTYRSVDNFAKKLVAEGHTDTVTIKEQQDILRSMFAQLQDQIALRKKRLASAAEIHRYNRDINELTSRIQEKDANLTLDDLGRDLASTEALQRKHEVFERELVSVEGKISDLLAESTRLQNTYQGQTANSIHKLEEFVKTLWSDLKRKSSRKRHKLKDSIAFHKLNNSIRDQITWCIDMASHVSSDEPIHNVSDAEAVLRQLEEHRVVMDSREETLTRLLETGEQMIEDGHFAAEELTEKLELLLTEREGLYATWDDRKAEVDQAYHLHVFLRDARQVDSVYSSQEAVLVKADLGNSVDEVDFLLKKHENVEKLVFSQDEKLNAVANFAKKLISTGHGDAKTIKDRLTALSERRKKLQKDLKDRRAKLEDSRKIAQFYQDVVEAESWIIEKHQAARDESYKDPTNLESKLQKHQAFEAELTAHEDVIDSVQRNGEELISSGHFSANEAESRIESLYFQWEELLEASGTKGRKLEEARDHQKFNTEVDIADSCISDKEAIIASEDVGNDYDHCVRLQKKMKEFDQDLAVEEDRVTTINHLADKLVNEGHAGSALIYQRQQTLNERWNALQDKAGERRQKLAEACEIHAFDRSCKEVADMINEKDVLLSTEDLGRDLPGVEALIRKHDDVERALTVIEGKMEILENEAHRLVRSQPHMARTVQANQSEIIDHWEQLNDKFDERKGLLEANRLLQIFRVDYRDLTSWMSDLASRISSGELAKSVKDAQALLDLHKERKSEIDARQEAITASHAFGLSLVEQNHFAEKNIKHDVKNLNNMSLNLQELWKDRQKLLEQSYELQVFLASAGQADNWITNKQIMVANNESNDSLDTVQSLLKTQVNFEKSIAAYEENIKALDQSANGLIGKKHYDTVIVKLRRDEVLEKWGKLKSLASAKSEKLGESKLLFQFLRDTDELESWINEKLQTAAEASYREASNLQLKLQKHQTFEAEVTANRGQLDSVIKDGDSLLKVFPNHRDTVEKRRKDLHDLWTLLEDLSANKAQRLKEAIQKQTFDRNVTELETWVDEVDGALSSKEYGKDLRSVRNLLKKHEHIEEDILSHEERVNEILQQAEVFEEAGHFQNEEIGERAADVSERFEQLSEPATKRKHKLQDSLVLYQFINDVQEQMDWIREKEHFVTSEDYGHNLNGVQNLIKKHEAFEAELTTHKQFIESVNETAKELVNRGHFATGVIMENCTNLKTDWSELNRSAEIRKTQLDESLATQKYYAQVSEIEAWLQEKLPLVSNEDYGRDETSAQTLVRKHEALELELEIFNERMNELELQCTNMVQQGNCEADTIETRQRELQDRYTELSEISSYRHRRLLDSYRLHIFLREVDEVEAWIEERETIVTSEDCGRDLEHVDMLMEKFEAFTRDLVVSGERIAKLTCHAQELLDEEHSDSEIIEERAEQICSRWEILKERTNTRLNALDRAKDIHTFNRNVEETKVWIQEKEAALTLTNEEASDLSSVQALQRKHEGFQRDLKALGKKVNNLSQDANVLVEKFPDENKHFSEQKQMITKAWEKLQQRASSKKSVLNQSEGLQTFLSDYKDLMSWNDTMMSTVMSEEEVSDFGVAEQLFAQHQENQAEVATREKSIHDFREAAQKLIKSGHPETADITDKNKRLSEAWSTLLDCFNKKQCHLEQVKEVQRFKQEADQLEGWLNARESDVLAHDVGDSLEAVEALLKKQEEFENILLAKGEHFQGLTRLTNQEMESERQKEKERQLLKQKVEMTEKKSELEKERQKIKGEVNLKSKLPELREQDKNTGSSSRPAINKKPSPEKVKSAIHQRQTGLGEQRSERKPKEGPKEKMIKEPHLISSETVIQPQKLHQQFASPLLQTSKNVSMEDAAVKAEGLLQRKQELDVGRRKAAIRAWKTFYTVLSDDKLLFYKDKNSALSSGQYASPAIDLKGSGIEEAVIRKNTFRVFVQDGSEVLFTAKDSTEFSKWFSEIQLYTKSGTSPEPLVVETLNIQNNEMKKEVKRSPSPNPIITVTSFDSDDDDVIDVGGPPITSPPPDIPPPLSSQYPYPDDMDIEIQEEHNLHDSGGLNEAHGDAYSYELADGNYMDILSEEDIHPEFYPDAPTDFNDNRIPDMPLIPPPEIPPDDFRDLEEGMVDDDDDISVYPKAPPPPVSKFPKTQTSFDQEGYISSDSDGLPSPPKAVKPPQQFSSTSQPVKPARKKRAPPPPRDKDRAARYRSDSQDSDELVPPPKPSTKPVLRSGHDDKKHDKKKGMFGFLKKKK